MADAQPVKSYVCLQRAKDTLHHCNTAETYLAKLYVEKRDTEGLRPCTPAVIAPTPSMGPRVPQ